MSYWAFPWEAQGLVKRLVCAMRRMHLSTNQAHEDGDNGYQYGAEREASALRATTA